MAKFPGSDDLLAGIFKHDIATPLTIINSAIDYPETDQVGFTELPEHEQEEVAEAVEVLERAFEGIDEGDSLDEFYEEFRQLSEYQGRFDGGVGEHFDCIGELSSYVTTYLDEFNGGEEEKMVMEAFLNPLDEKGAEIQYNGNRDAEVHGDPGLCLVANTVADNGLEHGKESEDYQMWAEIQELPDGYEIDIWDNGQGISEEYNAQQITQKGTGNGTGKGLHYASEIVNLFEGDLYHPEELQEKENGYGLRIELQKPEEA